MAVEAAVAAGQEEEVAEDLVDSEAEAVVAAVLVEAGKINCWNRVEWFEVRCFVTVQQYHTPNCPLQLNSEGFETARY